MKVEYQPMPWVHPEESKPRRKVIQIVDLSHIKVNSPGLHRCALAALCDDGTIWVFEAREKRWHKIKDVPQTEAEEDDNTGFVVL
jgi:uncharacterized Fe-S cluster protein YjdI